jgi:hypothetical protein
MFSTHDPAAPATGGMAASGRPGTVPSAVDALFRLARRQFTRVAAV